MKVLFVCSEMEPLAKVGGLADVAGALPGELAKLGCDVRVVLPFYRHVKASLERLNIEAEDTGKEVFLSLDLLPFSARIKQATLNGVPIYMLSNDLFFDRQHIYSTQQGDYADNDLRFGFLSLGALETAKALDFKPDIIHCHDWQTALIPIALRWRKHLKNDPFFKDSKLVFTIHNIAYQGLFTTDSLERIGLPWYVFTPQGLEFYGKMNLLKGGIIYSDLVSTVSPNYAEEIKTPKFGYGLDGVLRSVSESGRLAGILNGIDYDTWNPETDKNLYNNYSADNISGKLANKRKLGEEIGLHTEDGKPLLAVVSRLVEQKGVDLVVESLSQIFDLGFQLVILGTGEEKYERMLENARQRYRGSLSVVFGFKDSLARKIYAGCDMFLMPSRFEPCGLGQIIALRYGSIPVVRGTGGLLDTVRDCTMNGEEQGNGFVFHEFSKVSFLDALIRALALYENSIKWTELVKRVMKEDFSWKRSSEKYLELYNKLMRENP